MRSHVGDRQGLGAAIKEAESLFRAGWQCLTEVSRGGLASGGRLRAVWQTTEMGARSERCASDHDLQLWAVCLPFKVPCYQPGG